MVVFSILWAYFINVPGQLPRSKADAWFIRNRVKLNLNKSTLLYTWAKASPLKPANLPLQIGGSIVHPSAEATNLGVVLDNHLFMATQVRRVCKTASFHLWRIGRIRSMLDSSTTKCLINAFVMSRIDYANSLYFGLSGDLLDRLQRILNYAARLTCRTKGLPSTTGLLKSLNWLPVRQRILYKLSVLTFRCVHGSAPSYLSNLLWKPSRDRRGAYSHDLIVPRLVHYGDRSFSKAARPPGTLCHWKLNNPIPWGNSNISYVVICSVTLLFNDLNCCYPCDSTQRRHLNIFLSNGKCAL